MIVNTLNNATILTPSITHIYSLGMEYIKTWLFSRINEKAFKAVHIVDRDALDCFRNYDPITDLIKNRPSIAIESRIDMDYLNESAKPDGGLDLFLSRTKRDACFYNDPKNKVKIAMNSHLVRFIYTIKVRVDTKAQQLDWSHYLRQALRIGETQSHDYDMDFHVPKNLMLQLAVDCGFEVKDGEIVDIQNFLRHVNQYSYFPFMFRIRHVNQNKEFFIRIMDVTIHLSCTDSLSLDDGERNNMVANNFVIEFPVTLTMSSPQMYIYYSETKHLMLPNDKLIDDAVDICLHDIHIPDIPDMNKQGWSRFITCDCLTGDIDEKVDDYAYIEFKDLIKGDDIEYVYNHANYVHIHPSAYMDFKAYVMGKEVPIEMNWEKLVGKVRCNRLIEKIGIVMYTNKEYINNTLMELTDEKYHRITPRDKERDKLQK